VKKVQEINMRYFMVRYFHKISPNPKDVAGPIGLPESSLHDKTKLGAALRKTGTLMAGARVNLMRSEGEKIVLFPSAPGLTTYWHSIVLTPAQEGPDHIVFHVAEGSHVGWRLGNMTGSDPLLGKSPEKVIAARFLKIKKLYPSVRTKEVLPWGGSEGAFAKHTEAGRVRKMREEAQDLWRSIREREGATDGFTVSGLRDRVRILEEGISKMQPYVEEKTTGAADWQHGWRRELPSAKDRLAYFEERAGAKHERGGNPLVVGSRTKSRSGWGAAGHTTERTPIFNEAGKEIGVIQTRTRKGRILDTMTTHHASRSGVQGMNLAWLERQEAATKHERGGNPRTLSRMYAPGVASGIRPRRTHATPSTYLYGATGAAVKSVQDAQLKAKVDALVGRGRKS
jgi:hypothetical protein